MKKSINLNKSQRPVKKNLGTLTAKTAQRGRAIIIKLLIIALLLGLLVTTVGIIRASLSEIKRPTPMDNIVTKKPTKIMSKTSNQPKEPDIEAITNEIKYKRGTYALYIKDLKTNNIYETNSKHDMYAASLYKLAVAATIFKEIDTGELDLNQEIEIEYSDLSGGSGSLNAQPVGTRLTTLSVLQKLLKESDNTAQEMLIRTVGINKVQSTIKDLELQDSFFHFNIASAQEIGKMLEELYTTNYLKEDTKNLFFETMLQTNFDDRISAGLQSHTKFSHKIGSWGDTGSWHDCGIITGTNPKVVCLMSNQTTLNDFMEVAKIVGEQLN